MKKKHYVRISFLLNPFFLIHVIFFLQVLFIRSIINWIKSTGDLKKKKQNICNSYNNTKLYYYIISKTSNIKKKYLHNKFTYNNE
jgi:hypothetical protein